MKCQDEGGSGGNQLAHICGRNIIAFNLSITGEGRYSLTDYHFKQPVHGNPLCLDHSYLICRVCIMLLARLQKQVVFSVTKRETLIFRSDDQDES